MCLITGKVGLPLQFPSAFTTVHAPIPVDQRTHEGRYVWEPRLHAALAHPTNRLCGDGTAANLPDFSHFATRSNIPNSHVDFPTHYRINPYMEQVISSLHGNSAIGSPLVSDTRVPLSMDYLQQMSMLHQRNLLDVHNSLQASANSASELSLVDGSQIESPKPGVRHGRKRALSSSPYSDFDINSMIRFSPSSLVSFMNGSRSSSASGSYGHLSAGSLSPAMGVSPPTVLPHFHQLHHLMRQGLSSPYMLPPTPSLSQQPMFPGHITSSAAKDSLTNNSLSGDTTTIGHSTSNASKQASDLLTKTLAGAASDCGGGDEEKDINADIKDEPGDFIETNCHWFECGREFPTQEDLVRHICNDHIHSNKKMFICRWKDCSREEKPFKAQYMLVVHMRRHTGEKPHKCTFEGCCKAYSRLENLKTHLGSHTGEKPYLCEYPGCTKAFSNASDRAKHQNRTHSNEKPYVCKAEGCTKRYTDPSSLRKHAKTVHGAEFYAKKKHKGEDCDGNSGATKENTHLKDNAKKESPTSAVNTNQSKGNTSNTLQEVKEPEQLGPTVNGLQNGLCVEKTEQLIGNVPVSDSCVSTSNGIDVFEDTNCWDGNGSIELEDDSYLAAAVICGVTSTGEESSGLLRGKKSGLQKAIKSKTSWLPKLQLPKGFFHRNSSNKTTDSPPSNPMRSQDVEDKKTFINLSNDKMKNSGFCAIPRVKTENVDVRTRQNSTSSASTFYGSMSSDVSCQSQDASKHNQGSYATKSMNSTQSSSDPISVWGSRRSSEVSSVERVSPSNSMRLSSLRSELPVIEDTKDIASIPQDVANSCDKNTNSPSPEKIKSSPPDYFQATASRNQASNFSSTSNFSLATNQATKASISNRLSPIPQSPQLFPNHDESKNQNIDWNSDAIIDKNVQLDTSEQDSINTLDRNKELILPDDVVDYLNEVSKQEEQKNVACFQNQNINTDCCTVCKQDPQENQPFQNSCCNQSALPPVKPHYPNCAISHHMNIAPNNCASHDITHFNSIDAQNNFIQNSNNFQPILANGCKSEYNPQSCNQMASQHIMNGCNQQSWNTGSTGTGYQNQMCPSHNINPPAFYCSQQRYLHPPPPYPVPDPYPINNHQMQMMDNRCHMANCGSPQSLHVPQMVCSHNQVHHNMQTQPVYQCTGPVCTDMANNIQSNFQQINQNYYAYLQQGNQVHNHFSQYHQCSNCGAGQTFAPNHCYMNNSIQQRNTHQQFMPSSHNVQGCLQSSAQPPSATNTSTDISRHQTPNDTSLTNSAQKTLVTNNHIFTLPKTEDSDLQSTCANNFCVAASGGSNTMTIQDDSYDSSSQITDATSNGMPVSAQSIIPTGNMVINDMNSILTSLMEETKYLTLLQ